jgi:hypothetical protein
MTALFRKKEPIQFAVDHFFSHPHKFVRVEGEILWILVSSYVFGFLCRKIMPLFASNLASSAARANRRIDKK